LALIITCIQAYLARTISDEFSESKYIGVAIYGWLQTALIGVPILFLIDDGNTAVTYFLQVALVFVTSMSMMSIIFAPAFFNYNKDRSNKHTSRVSISGLALNVESHQTEELRKHLSNSNTRLSNSNSRMSSPEGGSDSFRQQLQSLPEARRVQLGVMCSIDECLAHADYAASNRDVTAQAEEFKYNRDERRRHSFDPKRIRVSGNLENSDVKGSAAVVTKKHELIHQQANLHGNSPKEENVQQMMAHMLDVPSSCAPSLSDDEKKNDSIDEMKSSIG
jgi:7 transmembrane sweet-taste receptor of 3 GCPR